MKKNILFITRKNYSAFCQLKWIWKFGEEIISVWKSAIEIEDVYLLGYL